MFKRRRGIFKGVVLYVLRSKPLSGYEILKELSRLSAGRYVPSPGTLYPLLSYLESEGLITAREVYVGRRRKKIYELTPRGVEELAKLLDDEEFRGLVQVLESGAAASDLLAAIRDELVYIDEVFDEVEGRDETLLEEVLTLLKRLEEKVSTRLAPTAERQELGLGVFLRHLHAVYVIEVQGGVFYGEELLSTFETDYVHHVPLVYLHL